MNRKFQQHIQILSARSTKVKLASQLKQPLANKIHRTNPSWLHESGYFNNQIPCQAFGPCFRSSSGCMVLNLLHSVRRLPRLCRLELSNQSAKKKKNISDPGPGCIKKLNPILSF